MTASTLASRAGRRLRQAHENGYLDAACHDNPALVKAYGLWCWRLKIPMVWFERRSPRSRFGRLQVDLLTSPNILTPAGQDALRQLGASEVSAHDAAWDHVPLAWLDGLAHAAFRATLQTRNYRRDRTQVASMEARRRKPLTLVRRRIASA